MVKVKASKLTGSALDWAAAKCLGYVHADGNIYLNYWAPSTDWSQGGPIIDRENLTLFRRTQVTIPETERYQAVCGHNGVIHQGKRGPTYLIAAIRCFVASKLGDEVDVPEELIK